MFTSLFKEKKSNPVLITLFVMMVFVVDFYQFQFNYFEKAIGFSSSLYVDIGKYALNFFWFISLLVLTAFLLPSRRASAVVAGYVTLIFIISIEFYSEFFHLPNISSFMFTLEEPVNTLILSQSKAGIGSFVIGLLFFMSWFVGFRYFVAGVQALRIRLRTLLKQRVFVGFMVVMLISLSPLTLGWHRFETPTNFGTNSMRVFFQYALFKNGNTSNLRAPTRVSVKPETVKKSPFNILLIIHESLRADAVDPRLDFGDSLMADQSKVPFLAYLESRSEGREVYSFLNGYSNSNTTNVSVPTILTGVHPDQTSLDYHRYPTLWNYAEYAFEQTFLYSSQNWEWEHFNDFFLDKSVKYRFHKGMYPDMPYDNDVGLNDSITVDYLVAHLKKTSQENFFGVVQFNNTHPPFYVPSVKGGELKAFGKEKYRSSIDYMNKQQNRLFAALDSLGVLDNTVILITSDHGQDFKSHEISRHVDFYNELVRVPMVLFVPQQLQKSIPEKFRELEKTVEKPAQHVDIAPTVLDLMGVEETQFTYWGTSMLDSNLMAPRAIYGMGTCEIRKWQPEGFFILSHPNKYIIAQGVAPGLYNVESDPYERNNILNNQNIQWAENVFSTSPSLQKICKRIGTNYCSFDSDVNVAQRNQ